MSGIAPGPNSGGSSVGFNFLDANGAGVSLVPLIIPVTILAAANTQVALGLPAGVMVQMISGYVETAIPTATNTTVGTPISPSYYSPTLASAHGSTFDMWTSPPAGQSIGPFLTTGNEVIQFTPNLTPATATGVVDLHVLYWKAVRATS